MAAVKFSVEVRDATCNKTRSGAGASLSIGQGNSPETFLRLAQVLTLKLGGIGLYGVSTLYNCVLDTRKCGVTFAWTGIQAKENTWRPLSL